MRIIPTIGLNNISFGIKCHELIKILGQPSRDYFLMDDHLLEYDNLKARFHFLKEENMRLSHINLSSENHLLNDKVIIYKKYRELEGFLQKILNGHPETENCGTFMTMFYPKSKVELQVEYSVITVFSFSSQK